MGSFTQYPQTKGDFMIYKEVRKRDRYKCILCFSNKQIEVHHCGKKLDADDMCVLCKACHGCVTQFNSVGGTTIKRLVRLWNWNRLNLETPKQEVEEKRLELLKLVLILRKSKLKFQMERVGQTYLI